MKYDKIIIMYLKKKTRMEKIIAVRLYTYLLFTIVDR